MELKGIITLDKCSYDDEKDDYVSLTCCESVPNIKIGGVSLHGELYKLFGQDEGTWFDRPYNLHNPKVELNVRYVILDEAPDEDFDLSFNDLALSVIDGVDGDIHR